ncbi:MAG: hypothetical protein ACI965_002411 [Paraglaciecola sp.]|jgi:hypothetical protein
MANLIYAICFFSQRDAAIKRYKQLTQAQQCQRYAINNPASFAMKLASAL